jgi:hypothetical protein
MEATRNLAFICIKLTRSMWIQSSDRQTNSCSCYGHYQSATSPPPPEASVAKVLDLWLGNKIRDATKKVDSLKKSQNFVNRRNSRSISVSPFASVATGRAPLLGKLQYRRFYVRKWTRPLNMDSKLMCRKLIVFFFPHFVCYIRVFYKACVKECVH